MDKLISADSLWMTIIRAMDYCEDILEFIEKEPEAVVRCGECKYANDWNNNGYYTCNLHKLGNLRDDFYCADGEEK